MSCITVYSEDLRKKIVEALQRGMKSEATCFLQGEPPLGQALRQAGRRGPIAQSEETIRLQVQDGPEV